MRISLDEVRRIATLAHLEFDDQEYREIASQLSDILGYVEKLRELDTSSVSPTSHLLEEGEALRDDTARPSVAAEEALANAPERGSGHFKVPKVIG